MFTFAWIFLCGIVGLALEVGWSAYVAKKAQAAADAAVLSALSDALTRNGPDAVPECGPLGCQSLSACPSVSNLQVACQYAASNGFSNGGDQGRQTVQVAAGNSNTAPGVPNVPVEYWVQVRARAQMPQWFSGFASGMGLAPGAISTGALRRTSLTASIYLLNRAKDCFASALNIGVVCGENFLVMGDNIVNARGGIYMSSSNASGVSLPAIAAGAVTGLAQVNSPYTYLMGNGGIQNLLGSTQWNSSPINGFPDGDYFTDPFVGRPQPPAPAGMPDHPVPGGVIAGSLSPSSPTVLPPGNYFATLPLLGTATGTPVTITGNVIFSDGAAKPCGGFCNYVFYGGIVTGSLSTVTFSPGRYVFAGAQPVSGAAGIGLSLGASAVIQDLTPLSGGAVTQNTDAGEIFIFADKNYPGLAVPAAIANSGLSFPEARAGIMAGAEPQVTLHGLNASSPDLPPELAVYAPVLIWQDRANTTLKLSANGLLDLSCNGPCPNTLAIPGSQEMVLMASQNGSHAGVNMYGTIYGPRQSWLTVLGTLPGDTVAGPLQIISGALQMTAYASLDVNPLLNPPQRLVLGLIE